MLCHNLALTHAIKGLADATFQFIGALGLATDLSRGEP